MNINEIKNFVWNAVEYIVNTERIPFMQEKITVDNIEVYATALPPGSFSIGGTDTRLKPVEEFEYYYIDPRQDNKTITPELEMQPKVVSPNCVRCKFKNKKFGFSINFKYKKEVVVYRDMLFLQSITRKKLINTVDEEHLIKKVQDYLPGFIELLKQQENLNTIFINSSMLYNPKSMDECMCLY